VLLADMTYPSWMCGANIKTEKKTITNEIQIYLFAACTLDGNEPCQHVLKK
jgi:hypothetical protein